MKLKTEIQKFRLGVCWSDLSDAASLSRITGPLREMQKQDARLEIIPATVRVNDKGQQLSPASDWDWLRQCDAVLFSGPFMAEHVNSIMYAKICGCKVWCDYFDDLLNVRVSNPNAAEFIADRAVVRQNLERIIELSDVVTCTTETIRQSFSGGSEALLKRIVVVPESCRWPKFELPRKRLISWRGLCSHQEDLESVLPAIESIAKDAAFADWDWLFMGDPSWKVTDIIPKERLIIAPATHPYQFIQLWGGAAPFIHIVPIVDNKFNRAKTPLAWMEASAIGAAVIGPKLPEWDGCNGLIQYDGGALDFPGKRDFETVLREELAKFEVVSAPSQNGTIVGRMHPNAEISRADIWPDKTLETVNQLRWIILNNFLKSRSEDAMRGEPNLEIVK